MIGTSKPERREETEAPKAGELERIPTNTLIGDYLARASPVVVSAHEEEVAVGEQEGTSEAVLTNEPMEQPCEKVVKQEIIEEERAVEENPTVSTTEAVLGNLPPARETEEVLVKQEWVELCEQRRLPIQQKYQL